MATSLLRESRTCVLLLPLLLLCVLGQANARSDITVWSSSLRYNALLTDDYLGISGDDSATIFPSCHTRRFGNVDQEQKIHVEVPSPL